MFSLADSYFQSDTRENDSQKMEASHGHSNKDDNDDDKKLVLNWPKVKVEY